jgi:predicted Rossmann fold flavoprotein
MGKKIAVIGGGAAGFFTAINIAERAPDAAITLYEASNKLLAKVLISGGGRCNVTNVISDPIELSKNYPRGQHFLKPVFEEFSSSDTQKWFEEHGVPLKTEADGRVFPASNSSQSIYQCLTKNASKCGVRVQLSSRLKSLSKQDDKWKLTIGEQEILADTVVLATGSGPSVYKMLAGIGLNIVPPLPSLFTFNAAKHTQLDLAGVSTGNATVSIKEIKNSKITGPILITHWGYTAPAILKLSAWYARDLAALQYKFTLQINWNSYNAAELTPIFRALTESHPKDKVSLWREHGLPKRLWQHLLEHAKLQEFTNWSEIGKKGILRLVASLSAFEVVISGKSTFKEEFVTAGGIALEQVNNSTFALSNYENLYAVGEVLDIDAVTGGFNFQAAWSGSYLAAKAIAASMH